jgi:tetratricopeptide (TPR) repeat protein
VIRDYTEAIPNHNEDTRMSDYKVQPLNGLLAKAGSCRELMEAVIPWAEPILADLGEVAPRLFFVTQDGEDGLLTTISQATGEQEKDELAGKLRRFCALRGVKACALLFTGNIRELPPCEDEGSEGPVEQQADSAAEGGEQEANEHPPAREQIFPVGTFLGWLCGEFLGEAGRACVWKVEPSMGPVRVPKAWNIEVARGLGRFVNLLGQGREPGYPISDELRDRIAAYLESNRARDPKPGNILSFGKGKTAGELAVETVDGPAPNRIVEKDGFLYFIGLYSGEPTRRAKKSQLLAALGIDGDETPHADEMQVDQQPGDAEDYCRRGLSHGRMGQHDKAIADFSEAIRLKPDYAEAYYNRGLGYGITGDHDKAIADFTEVIRLRPDVAEAYFSRGVAYEKKGDHEQAIANFTEAIRLRPDYPRAYYSRGLEYGRSGNHDKAVADFTKAIELRPDYAEAYCDRGAVCSSNRDYARAIADLTEAIRLKPDYVEAYYNRGAAHGREGNHDQAIADYTEAVRLKPDWAQACNNRGVAYGETGDYERAIADFTEAIRLRPGYAMAYYNRGFDYWKKGDHDKAIADYTEVIRLRPDYAKAYYNRGVGFGLKGDHDKAIADFTEAVRLCPDDAEAYCSRALAYTKKADFDRAIADYTEAIRLRPDDGEAYHNRGAAYREKGMDSEAEDDFARAKELGFSPEE